jgi:hypothetical protein
MLQRSGLCAPMELVRSRCHRPHRRLLSPTREHGAHTHSRLTTLDVRAAFADSVENHQYIDCIAVDNNDLDALDELTHAWDYQSKCAFCVTRSFVLTQSQSLSLWRMQTMSL